MHNLISSLQQSSEGGNITDKETEAEISNLPRVTVLVSGRVMLLFLYYIEFKCSCQLHQWS